MPFCSNEETWHSRFAISRKRGYCRIYFTTTTGTTGTTPLEQIIEEAVLEAVLWGLLDEDFENRITQEDLDDWIAADLDQDSPTAD